MIRWMIACGMPALALCLGCGDYRPAPSASPAPAAAKAPAASAPPAEAPRSPSSPALPPSVASPAAPAPPSASPESPRATFPIALSAGTALAQTLPEGTAVGFSVDYRFVAGGPSPQERYFWVVSRKSGPAAKIAVKLDGEGNLMSMSPWKPEDGPFESHLEDQSGRRLSAPAAMRSP